MLKSPIPMEPHKILKDVHPYSLLLKLHTLFEVVQMTKTYMKRLEMSVNKRRMIIDTIEELRYRSH